MQIFKLSVKMSGVCKSNIAGNFRDALIGRYKQLACRVDSFFVKILIERNSVAFLEKSAEVRGIIIVFVGDVL